MFRGMGSVRNRVATALVSSVGTYSSTASAMDEMSPRSSDGVAPGLPQAVTARAAPRSTGMPLDFIDMPSVTPAQVSYRVTDQRMRDFLYLDLAKRNAVDLANPVQKEALDELISNCAKDLQKNHPDFTPLDLHSAVVTETTELRNAAALEHTSTSGGLSKPPPPPPGGGKQRTRWSGAKAFATASAPTVIVVAATLLIDLINEEIKKDPMVSPDRLPDLLGIDADQVSDMVRDTHVGLTVSSRLRESDVLHIEKIREPESQTAIIEAIAKISPHSKPDQILVQFAGSGQKTEADFGKLDDVTQIAPGVSIGKIPGTNHLVVAIDGPGTANGILTNPLGTQPTPTGMAACANEVVKAIQASIGAPLKVHVETFSRGGTAGALYTQLNNTPDIHIGKVVMFDPEQGLNVSKCDRVVRNYDSLNVVRSGANQYGSGMPGTQLITDAAKPPIEHPVLASHGGTKDCMGDVAQFQRMLMEKDVVHITGHLTHEGAKMNGIAVNAHRMEMNYDTPDEPKLSLESRCIGNQMFCGPNRMRYAQQAATQGNFYNTAVVAMMLTMVSEAAKKLPSESTVERQQLHKP
jgi:hypothetical protein